MALSSLMRRPVGRVSIPKSLTNLQARALYRDVVSSFELEDHHRVVLLQGCLSLQRAEAAREQVEREGMTTLCGKTGRVLCHPCVSIEREARVVLLRSLRELGLDLAEEPKRPPVRQGKALKFPPA